MKKENIKALKYAPHFEISGLAFMFAITTTCYAMDNVTKAAQRFDAVGDYRCNFMHIEGRPVAVTSYFDLTKHASVVEKAFKPDHDPRRMVLSKYDFRPLETMYCRLAGQSQPFYVRYRGSIGLVASAAAASAYFNYRQHKQQSKY